MSGATVQLRRNRARALPGPGAGGPRWLVFQLLERCNLRCRMCYEWGDDGAYHGLPALAELEVDSVLRTLRECLPQRPYVELFGGEPLLYKGLWEVLELVRSERCELAFPTNGTLLSQHAGRLVSDSPMRVWVSLDGPREVNDAQRGPGVYDRALEGIAAVHREKQRRGLSYPELCLTFVVTPDNHLHIQRFFEEIDLSLLGAVSLELQSYVTAEQHRHYARVARETFGVAQTPGAAAYVRDPAMFAGIDVGALVQQMQAARAHCDAHGVRFYSQPRTLEVETLSAYLSGNFGAMADHHARCAMPWVSAEITARGEVSPCHAFYDISIGNIHEQSLLEIWNGPRAQALRGHLREQLFDVCTACCRYYTASAHPIGARP